MKTKVLFLLAITSFISLSSFAQRSVRIGYIDTEYILQNVPEYQNATSQLDTKVDRWKKEIEVRLSGVDLKKKQLSSESVLLTPELIQERQEEITIEENEIFDYQQKRFGPNGDLMIQRKQLMQPVQDQIFTAVQEIASNKKYDFVFDKSADVVMLYSADRYDISDQVLRSINRTAKRTQAQSRKEKKAADAEVVVPVIDEGKDARAKALEDKKATRAQQIADKRAKQLADREAKKKALEEKKQKILEDRAKARGEKLEARNGNEATKQVVVVDSTTTSKVSNQVNEAQEEGAKTINVAEEKKEEVVTLSPAEAKKQALEDKKKKIVADRQAKLEAQKSEKEAAKTTDGTESKKLSPKELRKQELEEKKKRIIDARKAKIEAQKKAKDSIKNN